MIKKSLNARKTYELYREDKETRIGKKTTILVAYLRSAYWVVWMGTFTGSTKGNLNFQRSTYRYHSLCPESSQYYNYRESRKL
ncbi:hypothetical protein LINPERHAP1_LOCUS3531 [Linum perenne]